MTKGVWQNTIVNDEGQVLPSASVTFRYVDGSLADLFSDVAGTPLIGNPQITDSTGFIKVYLTPGVRHNITAVKNGLTKTWSDVVVSVEFSMDFAESINAADSKATLVDADLVGVVDTEDSNTLKKWSFANIKASLKAYFETLFASIFVSSSIFGIIPSNGTDATNDIDFSSGKRRDSANAYPIVAGSSFTKRADATWASGTGNGGKASGASAWGAGDWHWHLLGKSSDPNAFDYVLDSSLTCVNGLADAAVVSAGFNIYKRVCSFRTSGAAWPLFSARETSAGLIAFLLKTPVYQFDKDWSGADDTAQTGTLGGIPGGIQVNAILGAHFQDATTATTSALLITSLDQTDTAASSTNGSFVGSFKITNDGSALDRGMSGLVRVRTSTSRTFRYRTIGSTVDHAFTVCLQGWEDSVL